MSGEQSKYRAPRRNHHLEGGPSGQGEEIIISYYSANRIPRDPPIIQAAPGVASSFHLAIHYSDPEEIYFMPCGLRVGERDLRGAAVATP